MRWMICVLYTYMPNGRQLPDKAEERVPGNGTRTNVADRCFTPNTFTNETCC